MKNLQRSTLIRVAVYGGFVVLAASIWAWALGFEPWHGAVVGAVLGLAFGVRVDKMMEEIDGGNEDFTAITRFVTGTFVMLFFLALSIIGGIVGFVIRLVS